MSVYYEALTSGRLLAIGWAPAEEPKRNNLPGTRKSCKGIRPALRRAKRLEAEERNAQTPHERTRKHRREIEQAAERIVGKKVRRG